MIKAILVGKGNVSYHLAKVFKTSEKVALLDVLNGRENPPENILNRSDVCIIAVSDNAIEEVAKRFLAQNILVVHTSGSVPLAALPNERKGVLYPLQTFSKSREVDFSEIPICMEASNENDSELLLQLAKSISKKVHVISSYQRKQLHLAAIFANNFTNHMYQLAFELCEKHRLSFEMLQPLIFETADKLKTLKPFDAQTGPARRADENTIKRHLELLLDSPQREIYSLLTHSIANTYGKKL